MTIELDGVAATGGQIIGIKTDLGVNLVDNTPDSAKPASGPVLTALNLKADASALAAKANAANAVLTGTTTLGQDAAAAMQAVTLQQLQAAVMGVGKRTRARVATTANITIGTALVTGQVLNGVTLAAGDLVLVKDQTTGAQNGVYVAGTTPVRAAEFDTWAEFPGSIVAVYEGTSNPDTLWFCSNNDGGTLNTTAIVFSQFNVAGAALTSGTLAQFAATTSAQLAGIMSDETGTGALVFGNSPDLNAPRFLGTVTKDGSEVRTGSPMAANVIDITKERNTKSAAMPQTYTFSTAPSVAGTTFGFQITVTTAGIMTLPSFISAATQGSAKTTLYLPLGEWMLYFHYDGTSTYLYGEPGSVNDYAATTAPVATDDSSKGYTPGSLKVDNVGHRFWINETAGVGTATWLLAGYPGIPIVSLSAAYTAVLLDGNKCLYHPVADTTARIWTIPSNAAVAYPVGTTLMFDNAAGAGALTISITTDTLQFVGAAGGTGSRALASGGRAMAVKVEPTLWRISGTAELA